MNLTYSRTLALVPALVVTAMLLLSTSACTERTDTGEEVAADTAMDAEAMEEPMDGMMEADNSIVGVVIDDPRFSTLATALQEAGLVDMLRTGGPYTVFAPTNEAFDELSAETVEALLTPENQGRLEAILTYHVVAGELTASEVQSMASLTTANGGDIQVITRDNQVVLNPESEHAALIVEAGIPAENGIIHAVSDVLTPPEQ